MNNLSIFERVHKILLDLSYATISSENNLFLFFLHYNLTMVSCVRSVRVHYRQASVKKNDEESVGISSIDIDCVTFKTTDRYCNKTLLLESNTTIETFFCKLILYSTNKTIIAKEAVQIELKRQSSFRH